MSPALRHGSEGSSLPSSPPPLPATFALWLQRQVQALVEAFGLDPALSPALRELWLALLAHSRLLEPATLA